MKLIERSKSPTEAEHLTSLAVSVDPGSVTDIDAEVLVY